MARIHLFNTLRPIYLIIYVFLPLPSLVSTVPFATAADLNNGSYGVVINELTC